MAGTLVRQTEAAWAAHLAGWGWSEEDVHDYMALHKRDGLGLFVFARVCKGWRKAQPSEDKKAPGWCKGARGTGPGGREGAVIGAGEGPARG